MTALRMTARKQENGGNHAKIIILGVFNSRALYRGNYMAALCLQPVCLQNIYILFNIWCIYIFVLHEPNETQTNGKSFQIKLGNFYTKKMALTMHSNVPKNASPRKKCHGLSFLSVLSALHSLFESFGKRKGKGKGEYNMSYVWQGRVEEGMGKPWPFSALQGFGRHQRGSWASLCSSPCPCPPLCSAQQDTAPHTAFRGSFAALKICELVPLCSFFYERGVCFGCWTRTARMGCNRYC